MLSEGLTALRVQQEVSARLRWVHPAVVFMEADTGSESLLYTHRWMKLVIAYMFKSVCITMKYIQPQKLCI